MQMPILDGLQTSTILRVLQSSGTQVPIIATTAYGPAFDQRQISSIGVNAFLPKPIVAQELVRLVDNLAGKYHHMHHEHDEAADGRQAESPAELAQINIPGTLIRLNGDRQLLRHWLVSFSRIFRRCSKQSVPAWPRGTGTPSGGQPTASRVWRRTSVRRRPWLCCKKER